MRKRRTNGASDAPAAWRASAQLADVLATHMLTQRGPVSVTWLNHYSILRVPRVLLDQIDLIAVDGTLLQIILALRFRLRVPRTSADMLVPILASQFPGARIALIGGRRGIAELAAARLPSQVVLTADGYAERNDAFWRKLESVGAEICIFGLGAGLQEEAAIRAKSIASVRIAITAGGFLDQLAASEQYFPHWVHALRLGWLLRLLREPQRLIRRYTIDVGAVICHHSEIRSIVAARRRAFRPIRLTGDVA